MILDAQPEPVFAEHRFGKRNRFLAAFEVAVESFERVELFVAPPGHGGVQAERAGFFACFDGGIEPFDIVLIARQRCVQNDAHVVPLGALAQGTGRCHVVRHEARLASIELDLVAEIEEIGVRIGGAGRPHFKSESGGRASQARDGAFRDSRDFP